MANCSTCNKTVQDSQLGKYCVRFGANIKQFCSNVCLDEYKKGLKVCCYCQKDISGGDGFLAPIGDKGQFKDFCAQECIQVWPLQIFYCLFFRGKNNRFLRYYHLNIPLRFDSSECLH